MPEEQRETHEKNGCPSVESACEHERFGCAVKVSKEEYRRTPSNTFSTT